MIRSLVKEKNTATRGTCFIERELIFQFSEAAYISNRNLTIPLVGISIGIGFNLCKIEGLDARRNDASNETHVKAKSQVMVL